MDPKKTGFALAAAIACACAMPSYAFADIAPIPSYPTPLGFFDIALIAGIAVPVIIASIVALVAIVIILNERK